MGLVEHHPSREACSLEGELVCLNDKVRMRGELKYSAVNRGPNGKVSHRGRGVGYWTSWNSNPEPYLKLICSVVHIWSAIMMTELRNDSLFQELAKQL